MGSGDDVCVTVTLVDGLVLARSAFHHSINYRSVVVLGKATLEDELGQATAELATREREHEAALATIRAELDLAVAFAGEARETIARLKALLQRRLAELESQLGALGEDANAASR